jgi:hypothetical protein
MATKSLVSVWRGRRLIVVQCLSKWSSGCSPRIQRIGLWSKSKMAVRIVHMYYPFSLDPPDLERWILIKPQSPLFEELRRQHVQQGRSSAGSL